MSIKTTMNRVKQLMKENELDTNDELLMINLMIIYQEAQIDYIKEQLNEEELIEWQTNEELCQIK